MEARTCGRTIALEIHAEPASYRYAKRNSRPPEFGYCPSFVRQVFNLPDRVVAALLRRCAHLSQVAGAAV
jgi:hypothetical protein